jgi:U6 snRNA-associated Sm-like protein LSm8
MSLKEYLGKDVTVITADGRNIVGKLRGFDKNVNIVLEKSHERVFSVDKGVVKNDLGLYLVRGDNIVLVGLLDGEEDAARDLSDVKAQPLKPVVHEVM